MKISCPCGALIQDNTDGLAHKGHVLGDRHLLPVLDALDQIAGSNAMDPTVARLQLAAAGRARLIWECRVCGRLLCDDAHGKIVSYLPESGGYHRILDR